MKNLDLKELLEQKERSESRNYENSYGYRVSTDTKSSSQEMWKSFAKSQKADMDSRK